MYLDWKTFQVLHFLVLQNTQWRWRPNNWKEPEMTTDNQAPIDLFERVDFEAWNGPNWDLFRQLHTDDVIVKMFGVHTEGIEAHVAACQAYQTSTPASKVLEHPVRMADGEWTCVISIAEGGVHFVTVAKWRDGAISEEYIMGVK